MVTATTVNFIHVGQYYPMDPMVPLVFRHLFGGAIVLMLKEGLVTAFFFKQGLLNTKLGCKKGNRIEVFF